MTRSALKHVAIGASVIGAGLGILALVAVFSLAAQQPKPKSFAVVHHTPKLKKPTPPPFTFPSGGRTLDDYRMVALYGAVDTPALGVLGEQPLDAGVARVKQLATEYQPYTGQHMYPAFEIIATVAAAEPTENGDYSREADPGTLKPWVDAAKKAGVYVVLDLQPGRSDFLTQARIYEPLLAEPHVGLALDPEWRLGPAQRHLEQIGSVGIDEVNATGQWLADLTKQHKLPQKVFLLHQFRDSMIVGREQLQQHPELKTVIQMDGNGGQQVKDDTWRAITATPPSGAEFGWKNFYDEDHPMLAPDATMQHIPQPWYVSYQ